MTDRIPNSVELKATVDVLLEIIEANWDGEGVAKVCAALFSAAWGIHVKPSGDAELLDAVFDVIREAIKEGRKVHGSSTNTH